ncbi:hypothetical protein [Amycolatopsis sp. NPDC059657]|uniref:hypothetical protein n=1 Tax=Amycolatopsis sp. NPDC059657 TaxID=3346899 RepID=UPI0036723967
MENFEQLEDRLIEYLGDRKTCDAILDAVSLLAERCDARLQIRASPGTAVIWVEVAR